MNISAEADLVLVFDIPDLTAVATIATIVAYLPTVRCVIVLAVNYRTVATYGVMT